MAINRFNQLQAPARFNPLSFEEASFAPLALREREDTLLNQQDELLNQLNNISVPDIYQEQFENEKQGFIDEINNLSNKITSEGAGNLNILGDFRNLRNKYNKSVSASGNIGRAANAQENINKVKDQYFKLALEQGFNAATINERWQEELEKYKGGLPNDLSKFNGNLPDFNPNYAPKNIDMTSEVQKLASLVKSSKKSSGNFSFRPNRDNTGQIINYTVVNQQGEEITNDPNVNALKSYMQERILNPNSELNQVLQFKGINPEEYLSQVDNLTNMMRANSSTRKVSYAGQTPDQRPKQGSGKANTKTTDTPKATFINQSNGMNRLKLGLSSNSIKEAIKDLKQDPTISEVEKNAQVNAYNHALKFKEKLEKSPEFKQKINESIANSTRLNRLGITNFQEYTNYINDPKNQEEQSFDVTDPATGRTTREVMPNKADEAEAMYQEAFESIPRDILADSNYYSLGIGKADIKLQKVMSEGIENINLESLKNTGALSIRSTDGNYTDESEELFQDLNNSSNTSFMLQGIDDGGIAGEAALVYQVTTKVDGDVKRHSMSIDMQNNDLSKQLLNPKGDLYLSLDRRGQLVLDQIRDNKIKYKGISTDVDLSNSFDQEGTNNILNHSLIANNELGIQPKSKQDKIYDYMFIKPDEGNYSLVINEDNSYSTYKDDGTFMSFDDLRTKFMAAEYQTLAPLNNLDNDSNFKDKYKVKFMNILLGNTINLDNPKESSAYYADNAEYSQILKDYYNATQTYSANDATLLQKALDSYNRISKMRLQTKNVKHAL